MDLYGYCDESPNNREDHRGLFTLGFGGTAGAGIGVISVGLGVSWKIDTSGTIVGCLSLSGSAGEGLTEGVGAGPTLSVSSGDIATGGQAAVSTSTTSAGVVVRTPVGTAGRTTPVDGGVCTWTFQPPTSELGGGGQILTTDCGGVSIPTLLNGIAGGFANAGQDPIGGPALP